MIPAAYYEYRIQIQGLFFTGALIGVIFAEIFCSGALSDWIVARLARRNGGRRTPEMRLWLGYPGAILSAIGLAVWGASVQKGWHWISGQIALFLFAVGLQAGNTTLSTYIVDSYPEHAIEVITYYSVIINVSQSPAETFWPDRTDRGKMSAFIVPWYIYDWTAAWGKPSLNSEISPGLY
jgi:MFS family permease